SSMDHPPVQKALNMLRAMSADEIEQQFAFERERALLIEQMELHAARAEGEAAGEAAGILKGEAAGLQKALARLIASGMPEDQARQILGVAEFDGEA
ncbi:hypothetical protein QMK79_28225, partial [Klebsiella pneumoniae]|uniref:hypothetical protein n=1 Tax=Klebsiella pneumoniae TaxID=573 RepID=UPI003A7FEFF8